MPNSLKSRLKKLEHQGLLSEKDLSRIYTDNDMVAELEKLKAEMIEAQKPYHCLFDKEYCEIIDKRISELKGEINGN